MKKSRKYILILASGGIDSTACINFYKNIHFDVELIFFDYEQPARTQEYKAVSAIAEYYNCNLIKVKVKNQKKLSVGLVLGRNAFFYFLALMNFSRTNGLIASGIHRGTGYYDCSIEFFNQIQNIYDKYSRGTIKVAAPFLNFNKKDIWNYCNSGNVPLQLTYSCELGKKQPCGKCATCKDLEAIYVSKK